MSHTLKQKEPIMQARPSTMKQTFASVAAAPQQGMLVVDAHNALRTNPAEDFERKRALSAASRYEA